MKILAIDTALDGHHGAYLRGITNVKDAEFVLALPRDPGEFLDRKVIVYHPMDFGKKRLGAYVRWMREIRRLAKQEQPDVIHWLNGDHFYKYFGLGLSRFHRWPMVVTLHWVRPGRLQRMSLRAFCSKADRVVVHSEYLLKELRQLGISNGVHIEYPQFRAMREISRQEARQYWHIPSDAPVLLALGNTRFDKGLDLLLDALHRVHAAFRLLIAGKPDAFDQAFMDAHTQGYADRVHTALRYLTDDEIQLAVAAADVVVLPYRFSFNGASGPLGEGVCRDACIIGAGHGNLGDTIRTHHLGYTFETENPEDLARVLTRALASPFAPDETYRRYKASLDPALFAAQYQKIYEEQTKP